jgi:peptidoglycan/LPS O-acetylase OafA/YrhL
MADHLLTHAYCRQDHHTKLRVTKPNAPLRISYSCSHLPARGTSIELHNSTSSAQEGANLPKERIAKGLHTNLNSSSQKSSIPFRPDIEGLRALAVVLVIASHAELPFLRGGFVGVDIFFVLSGYLITSLLTQEISSSGTVNFASFYARRARRLLPAAMMMVLVVCCAEAIIMNPLAQFETMKAALATVAYSSNLYFAHLRLQYFDQYSANNPLLHAWSLAVEEQFYLVWPVLLLLLVRTIKGVSGRSIALATISLASFLLYVWLNATNPILAFFETPARVWEFGAGGLLVHIPKHWLGGHSRLWSWSGGIGLITLIVAAELIPASMSPGYAATIPVFATILLLLAGVGAPKSPAPRLLGTRPAQAIGRLSYSLYLWHWPALVIGQQLIPDNSVPIRLGWIAAACIVAFVSYKVIESPIRLQPFLIARSALTLGLALLTGILWFGALEGWRTILCHSEQFRKYDRVVQDIPGIYRMGCDPDRADARPTMCFSGENTHPQSTVVLFGDSHAAQWFPALQEIADAQHWRLATVIKPGCTPLTIRKDVTPQMEKICEEWRRAAILDIEEIRPEIVFMASASRHPGADGNMMTDTQVWEQGARDTFAALAKQGAKVRLIRDTPYADYNVLSCLAQAEWDRHTQCPAPVSAVALSPDIYAAEARAAQDFGNVKLLDLSDRMCGPDRCYLEVNGQIIYRDGDHLTASYSRSLAAVLLQRLRDSER